MARALIVALGLAALLPRLAVAHGPDGHAPDPNLHVDPSLDDCSVQFAPELTQGAFRRFAREFGSVSAYKHGAPPATLGRGGFAIGVERISFSVDQHSDAWNDTFAHPDATHELGSDLSFPKLNVRVGLTDRLDIGAFYTENPNANYGWVGVEAKWALLEQSEDMPVSLAVRGAYTKTLYVTDMDMHAVSADAIVGRTLWSHVTPYVALGADAVLARETSDAVNLANEAMVVPRFTGGLEVRFWHVALGAEAQVSALTSYQAQVSVVF